MTRINAKGIHYKSLNEQIRNAVNKGSKEIVLNNVNGQRYIGDALKNPVKITINGVPGNDLAAFMDGPTIVVNNNVQDGTGNTMNSGKIVVHGDAGDIVGYAMRGGKIFVKGDVGYRVGIHMKSYKESYPVVVVGGYAYDFLGEYMAGGIIIVLAMKEDELSRRWQSRFIGTGMHGGTIFLRREVKDYQLGKEVGVTAPDSEDQKMLKKHVTEFAAEFDYNVTDLLKGKFYKLYPKYLRPYGRLYAY